MATVGWQLNSSDAVCVNHLSPKCKWKDIVEWHDLKPAPIDNGDECDTPTHCGECGELIPHALTEYGYEYVGDAILNDFMLGRQNPVTVQWMDHYGPDMDEIVLPDHGGVGARAAIELHRLLPRDKTWMERESLLRHARLVGWMP